MQKKFLANNVFCIGIGGIGVSGLAELLHQHGVRVFGSDSSGNVQSKRLQSLGITVFDQHNAKNIEGADLIVYSSAIKQDNPERLAAVAAHIPLLTRGQLLAEVMRAYCGIIVAGTHGKTTTSGLLAWVFEQSKKDPTFMIGGVLRDRRSPMQLGKSKFFIAESDESDASFLLLSPTVAVITNIDVDHMETYGHDFEKLKNAFLEVTQKIPPEGFVLACIDDPVVCELIPKMTCRVVTYGTKTGADYQLKDFHQHALQSEFNVGMPNGADLPIRLNLGGLHNALNALAAFVIADIYHLPLLLVQNALATFPGMGRRFHPHGEFAIPGGKALLFDDYGHHPVELKATLTAAKLAFPDRRIVLVFQPHRFSRTRDLMAEFVEVLQLPDQLILTEVYAANEQKIAGADGAALFTAVKKAGMSHAIFVPELSQLPSILQTQLHPGDVVILQGAGNIVTMVERLKKQYQETI
ncbi:MAG: UDP-N-acetylmuramate--L-alanine ligase [Gammaproteobacteria bacterium CG_4_10_14_0_8_um_filter_38_16]|nr:MAG: UDP-N-acetylmuramate--L-alanine ligase [Gammaproteobacteria bacterium CG_4_10_14_0_8_um_filter_38_16]PJA03793.1 MAG: UDP-N-acetylmuramate--L-alanine ligase [Gammaproteobacteria bacterium CG_4_10_14_0_2_um_filter_38_22]PJB10404.1 MAG: UDP-N-acetylmuramate--L-alanine ligase [Gammaproteobacteria bacterium CG_4_9_14_3_um_filter_38_9]